MVTELKLFIILDKHCVFQAYITICDALIIFSKNLAEKDSENVLVFEPDKSLQNQLTSFLMDKVFLEDDDGQWLTAGVTNDAVILKWSK